MIRKLLRKWSLLILPVLLTCWSSESYANGAESSECGFGRFACNLRVGVEFSQDDETFSKANPYVQFLGDTLWGKWKGDKSQFRYEPLDIHTFIDLSLASIPAERKDNPATTEKEDFVESKKSLIGAIGLDWRPLNLPEVKDYTAFLGLVAKTGLQTLTESPDGETFEDLDTVNYFWNVGIRIGERKTPGDATTNTPLKRYLDITWGSYEQFGDNRLTVEGLLQGKDDTGFFIGVKTIAGDGKDDVRVFTGVNLSFTKLENAVSGLIPAGLK